MRTLFRAIAALVAVSAYFVAASAGPVGAQQPPTASTLSVSIEQSQYATSLGDEIPITATVTNRGSAATGALVANINFVPMDAHTYVDPEDWSTERTVDVPPVQPGGSWTHTWTAKSVVQGNIASFVTVVPTNSEQAGAGALASSPAIAIHVEQKRAINPGNVLPVALGVPVFLGLAFAGLYLVRSGR